MLTKSRLIQLVIMLCLLIGLFIWRTIELSPVIGKNQQESVQDDKVEEVLCDFSEPCVFNSLWGAFSLSVEGGKIIPEQWFHLTLESEIENWQISSAKIVGKTMFMGKIPIKFTEVTSTAGKQQSTGKSMLGVCTEDKMLWRLDIVVEINGQPVNLYYDFLIVK